MAFEEVSKTPLQSEINALKRKYRAICKKYDSMKYRFQDSIGWEDFETLSIQDFIELKELYITKKKLYWKIHELEHPEDKATPKAYQFLNSMPHNEQVDFLAGHGLTTHELIRKIEENPHFLEEVTA